jgi:hypothetical protein
MGYALATNWTRIGPQIALRRFLDRFALRDPLQHNNPRVSARFVPGAFAWSEQGWLKPRLLP